MGLIARRPTSLGLCEKLLHLLARERRLRSSHAHDEAKSLLSSLGGGHFVTPESLDEFRDAMERTFAAAAESSGARDGETRPRPPRWDLSNQLQDAEAAHALIVKRAEEWGVDTTRIGMIGFSAGAGLTMHSTLHSETMKLAFIGPIYGGMGAVEVPKDAPPMFAAIATDDFLFRGEFGVIKSWFDAGRPVEFHLYQNGGHGFGLGNPNRTSNRWFEAFIHWLDVNGFLAPEAGK